MIHLVVESIEDLDKVEEELRIAQDCTIEKGYYIEGGFMYTLGKE